MLLWGFASADYSATVNATTSTISRADMCGAPASTYGYRDLGLIHTALLTGVRNKTSQYIYYKFGDRKTNDWSEEFRFRVLPLAGRQPLDRPTTLILYDDLGRGSLDQSYTWNEYGRPSVYTIMSVGEEVARGGVDAIYHGGDISYATGYIAVWDFFLDMVSPLTASVVYLTTVGNHESDWPSSGSYYEGTDSGGECGVPSLRLMPMPPPAVPNAPWWSYDVGLVHMIGISTEHNYTTGSSQWTWLLNDLQGIDRSKTPWVIFGGHRAMYLNSNYDTGTEVKCTSVNEHRCSPTKPPLSPVNPPPCDMRFSLPFVLFLQVHAVCELLIGVCPWTL